MSEEETIMSGIKCQRVGCEDTATSPRELAGAGGNAYEVYLCEKHQKDLKG